MLERPQRPPRGVRSGGAGSEPHQRVRPGPSAATEKGPVLELGDGALSEDPVGSVELGFEVDQLDRVRPVRRQPVRQPPATAVVDEDQGAVPAPVRLSDRSPGSPGHGHRRSEHDSLGALLDHRDPQLGPVPGHRRMVPGDPGETGSVRGGPWRRDEVRALVEDLDSSGAVGRDRHQRVRGRPVVELLDADQPPPARGRASVREAAARGAAVGGQGFGGARRFERTPVPALVGLVDVVEGRARDGGGSAPVLVDPAADAHLGWREILGGAPGPRPDHHLPAALGRTALAPVDRVVGDGQPAPRDPSGGDFRGGPLRRPPTEGGLVVAAHRLATVPE